jgi:hypothetical protein
MLAKERTAFSVGPLGFYEYNRMPFGLTNSPATYQRLMENILAGLNLKICCVFIDDVFVICLAWINLYTFFRDDISNKLYFSLEEFAFLW